MDTATVMGSIYGDGIIAAKAAFDVSFIDRLHREILDIFEAEKRRPGGVVPRGPSRYYVEIQPERLSGFVEIATHPWITEVCEAVLGPEYKIVEVGFDIPFAGAQDQPWHRDFPAPKATTHERRLDSLAFNFTTVDVTPDMGPFEIAVGTQWDDSPEFEQGMFPPKTFYSRYEKHARKKMPKRGDVSARSALTIHRGTANQSQLARPAVVFGIDAKGAINAERHDLQFSRAYYDELPARVREHVTGRVIPTLEPIFQAHQIDGLVEGAA